LYYHSNEHPNKTASEQMPTKRRPSTPRPLTALKKRLLESGAARGRAWGSTLLILLFLTWMSLLASLPLWHAKRVFLPQTPADRRLYAPLSVRVVYGLLCACGGIALLLIVVCAAWFVADSAGGATGFLGAIVLGIMLWLMLPLYIIYRALLPDRRPTVAH
jgi:uncharacterized RDD family membrane protein YckC